MRAKGIPIVVSVVIRVIQVVSVHVTRVHIAHIEVSIVRVSINATFSTMPYFINYYLMTSSSLLCILKYHLFFLRILHIFLNLLFAFHNIDLTKNLLFLRQN